jgi:hypothetical protein
MSGEFGCDSVHRHVARLTSYLLWNNQTLGWLNQTLEIRSLLLIIGRGTASICEKAGSYCYFLLIEPELGYPMSGIISLHDS